MELTYSAGIPLNVSFCEARKNYKLCVIAARLSLQIPVLNMSDVPSNFRIVSAFEGQMVNT